MRRPLPELAGCAAAAFLSGVAALAYEIGWARMLVPVLGNSLAATSLVLAGFMLGFSAGAALFGALADRVREPLRLYVLLEFLVCGCALGVPFLVHDSALGGGPRAGVAFLAVTLPALLMGAAVPVLARGLERGAHLPRRVGLLYGLNTLGAAAGAALTGFLGVPLLGVRISTSLAAALNAVAALVVLAALRRREAAVGEAAPISGASRRRAAAALVVAALLGASVLALETLWARILSLIFGYDTYAFAMLLVVVLAGLGAGGLVQRLVADRDQGAVLAALTALFPLAVVASLGAAAAMLPGIGAEAGDLRLATDAAARLRRVFVAELRFVPILAFLPALISGAALPAACSLWGGSGSTGGRRVGAVLLANGAGAVAGALLTPFVVTPRAGIEVAVLIAALLAPLACLAVSLLAPDVPRPRGLALPAASLAGLGLLWGLLPPDIARGMLLERVGPKHQEILHYEEGPVGTVSVVRSRVNGDRLLLVNSIIEVSTRLVHDQSFKLLGHLGFLLHPRPRTALGICLGGGISAGSAVLHEPEILEIAEIDPAVPAAARAFDRENNGVLDHPALRLRIEDGRRVLAAAAAPYDVIFVDSTHPKATDSWVLYTREFYELVRSRLAPDGMTVQWVPVHGMSEREFRIIVRTFLEVFPEATLWANAGFEVDGNPAYVKMVGTTGPLRIDYPRLAARLAAPRIAADLAPYGMDDPAEILDCFLAGPERLREWTAGLPVQTDDRPLVPYITSHSGGQPMSPRLLGAVREPVLPYLGDLAEVPPQVREELRAGYVSQGMLLAGRLDRAAEARPASRKVRLYREQAAGILPHHRALAGIYGDDAGRLAALGANLARLSLPAAARPLFEEAVRVDPGSRAARGALGTLQLGLGEVDRARGTFAGLLEDDSGDVVAAVNLALAERAAGDEAAARQRLRRVLDSDRDPSGEIRLFLAEGYAQEGLLEQAEAELERSTSRAPHLARAWFLRALVAIDRDRPGPAAEYLDEAIAGDPYLAPALYLRGSYLLNNGRPAAALADFDRALEIEPGLRQAAEERTRARALLGGASGWPGAGAAP